MPCTIHWWSALCVKLTITLLPSEQGWEEKATEKKTWGHLWNQRYSSALLRSSWSPLVPSSRRRGKSVVASLFTKIHFLCKASTPSTSVGLAQNCVVLDLLWNIQGFPIWVCHTPTTPKLAPETMRYCVPPGRQWYCVKFHLVENSH